MLYLISNIQQLNKKKGFKLGVVVHLEEAELQEKYQTKIK